MKYYSAINKNEIMSFAGKWMKLEIIILSNINQDQKEKWLMFHLHGESKLPKNNNYMT
jgi:hypothetical protein